MKRSDLVHVFPFVALPLGYAYKKMCKKPLLATFYELFFDKWRETDGTIKGGFFQFAESLFTKLSYDRCAALSQYTLSCMKSAGMDSEKMSVIYPGIDEAFFRDVKPAESMASLGDEIYMYFGRPGTSKGLNFLIEASKTVHEKRPDSTLVLMLSSEPAAYRKKIIDLAKGLDWIKIVPSVPHSEMPAYIAASDIAVLPSVSEGFCLTAAEASAQGKAVVATTAGALPEVIKDRETGLLVPPANSGALANAIISLLEDRSRRESLGRNGRKYVKRFTWDNMVEGYAKLYSGMCK